MARWKYLLIVVSLASWLASHLLTFISRYADWPLSMIGLGCWLALMPLALRGLLQRRWREFSTLLFTLVVMSLPGLGLPQPANWLQITGFRLYATPIEAYLARCKMFDFVDGDGSKQQVGQCEQVPLMFNAWTSVIYDTTGQLALAPDHRTKAWKSVMDLHLPAGAFVARTDGASRIFGNFYSVVIPFEKNSLLELMWLREP